MAAQVRVLRQRVKAVQSTQKTTKAMEMIATSRIAKAQAKVLAAAPYSSQITDVLTALATASTLDHPLLVERPDAKRAGILVITSDRGLCGGFNANVLKATEELSALLRSQNKEPVPYVIGRKGVGYFRFRQRAIAESWTGFSEKPVYEDAVRACESLLPAFVAGSAGQLEDGSSGIDEIHLVSTHFQSMISQTPTVRRVAPMEIEYVESTADTPLLPAYEFEPEPSLLLDALLPKYVTTRIFAALLDSAASESAARRAACKAATDNANDIIKILSRQANQARQAQITQELSEIVGGAAALAAAGSDED